MLLDNLLSVLCSTLIGHDSPKDTFLSENHFLFTICPEDLTEQAFLGRKLLSKIIFGTEKSKSRESEVCLYKYISIKPGPGRTGAVLTVASTKGLTKTHLTPFCEKPRQRVEALILHG